MIQSILILIDKKVLFVLCITRYKNKFYSVTIHYFLKIPPPLIFYSFMIFVDLFISLFFLLFFFLQELQSPNVAGIKKNLKVEVSITKKGRQNDKMKEHSIGSEYDNFSGECSVNPFAFNSLSKMMAAQGKI